MSELALQLIEENKRTKNPFLDLGNCGLNQYLPEQLLDCVWLETLSLGPHYYNTQQNDWFDSNNKQSHNRFSGPELTNLQDLTQLSSLGLRNTEIQNYYFLHELPQLKTLDLSSNKFESHDFLRDLTQIQTLYLRVNQIRDIQFLQTLTQLQSLDLSFNQIKAYAFLENLTQLQVLRLRNNQIPDTRYLEKLTQLQILDISYNQIKDIRFLENLTHLRELDLRSNQIKDIKPILFLIKNGIEINMTESGSDGISLFDNAIIKPPAEIIKQGSDKIIEYFEGVLKPLNECKLIFIGEGGVGKTSLMRRLVFDKFDKNEKATHGINKIAWDNIKNEKNETIRVNLWDFGGQHIQHSLHQFFFSERVIYVLILNPRNDLKANYWLDQIEKLGSGSEIIIVYNWKQQEDKQADFFSNFYELRKKYPKLPTPFLLSCRTGEGIETFKKAIIKSVLRNEGLKAEYLVEWFNIKQRLEKEVSIGKNYITYETYEEWCYEEDYKDPERQKSLLKILNSIGSIVFFAKPILDQLQVLNPEWITTGAYAILISEQNRKNKGHLTWNDLKEIFKEEKIIFSDKAIKIKYTERQFEFIIELMLQYDLCQRNPFKSNEFLLPSAFGEKPNKDYSFAKEHAQWYRLQFESPFEMLIMHRFIAKNLLKIIDKDYWQSGIYIKHPNSETFALIETNLYSQRIDCWIKGESTRSFWEMIRGDFKEISSIYQNFRYKEEVLYKRAEKEVFLPYDEMLNTLRRGKTLIDYHPTYDIENIDVMAILELFEDRNYTQETMKNEKKGDTITIHGSVHGDIVGIGSHSINTVNKVSNDISAKDKPKETTTQAEDIAVKNWKMNSVWWFFRITFISALIVYIYETEELILSNEEWNNFKLSEYDLTAKFMLGGIWTYFIVKMLYDRFSDPSKELNFRTLWKIKK